MAAKRTAGDDDVLPPEIVTEVLHRLPVKLILRCRSVCKSWYSLISSPNFVSEYSERNLNKNGNRVLLLPYDYSIVGRHRPLSSHDQSFMESHEHYDDLPQRFRGSYAEIVGSCNGLICLSKYVKKRVTIFLVWNPTIRKSIELPSRRYSVAPVSSYYGFGFDSKIGDYKVMCMHYAYSDRESCDRFGGEANVCEIYDLSKGVWRSIRCPSVQPWRVKNSHPECYLHGAVHWTGYIHRDDNSFDRILLSFDLSDEVFREMVMPNDVGDRWIETRSVTFGGLVHVIVWKTENSSCYVDASKVCSIWAMKEYGVKDSWCKLFNIDVQSAQLYGRVYPEKFHFYENGEVLMVHDIRGTEDEYVKYHMYFMHREGLVLYNTESRECRSIFSHTQCISDLCLYEESLVLM